MAQKTGKVPPDVEAVLERHVRSHVANAMADLRAANAGLGGYALYNGSPVAKAVAAALAATEDAHRKVSPWQTRTAPQVDAFAAAVDVGGADK